MAADLDEFRQEWMQQLAHDANGEADHPAETAEERIERESHEKYRRACQLEREGNVVEAMHLFRESFLMNPRLGHDRVEQARVESEAHLGHGVVFAPDSDSSDDDEREHETGALETRVLETAGAGDHDAPADTRGAEDAEDAEDDLALLYPRLLAAPLCDLAPIAPIAEGTTHMNDLPVELQLLIISMCDLQTVERCGQVCRRWYILSRDFSVWKWRCEQILSETFIHRSLGRVGGSWRRLLMRAPRVHFNGLYMCKQSYFRRGRQKCRSGTIYEPLYEVVHWRYFRFFPDGTLLSLSTPEHPATVHRWLGQSRRQAQEVRAGQWELEDGHITAWVRGDQSTFNFEMELARRTLRAERKAGRALRIQVTSYEAMQHETRRITQFQGARNMTFQFASYARLATVKAPRTTQHQ